MTEAISLWHRQEAYDTLKKMRLLRRLAPRSDGRNRLLQTPAKMNKVS